MLDVGCGGGAASIPLAPNASTLIGVDSSPEMLAAYARAAAGVAVAHHKVLGGWPGVAEEVPTADVVVCRNVVYNVAEIVPFVTTLSAHATRRVVVETHPTGTRPWLSLPSGASSGGWTGPTVRMPTSSSACSPRSASMR